MPAELMVLGTAEVHVMPDHASLRVTVDGEAGTQAAAYAAAAEHAHAVDAVLEGRAAATGGVMAAAIVVHPKTRWRKGESVRTGWRAERTTIVEVTDLAALGALIAELTAAEGAVTGPEWALDPANPAHEEVRTAAARDARRRAGAYAAGLGLRVDAVAWAAEPGLRAQSDGDAHGWSAGGGIEVRAAAALAGMAGDPDQQPIAVSPSEITLRASVEVGFTFTAAG
ncbi:hypothetical protein DSM112329_03252 [Paraconexibacter sp. AEG42_29]|uniref:DUF541 domain-containing protein n=1 Tax=Paraconexibacter sp. AEG42_29 TaxID=2997339 RepID=A0AAU7AXK0_9ACTN